MNVHTGLLSLHQPGEGWLFWFGAGWKYPLMPTLSPPALIIQIWPVILAALAPMITSLASSGIDPTWMLWIGRAMWLVPGLLATYQLVVLDPRAVVVMPRNLLLVVFAVRLLTLTTPTPELLNALIMVLRLIRFVGLNSERVALVIAPMIHSILYLLGLFDDARDAARAHGAGHNVVTFLMSMVFGSVAHVECTGEALVVRGLGEREQ